MNYGLSFSVGVWLSGVAVFELFETRMEAGTQILIMKLIIKVGVGRKSVAESFLFPPNDFEVEFYNCTLLLYSWY